MHLRISNKLSVYPENFDEYVGFKCWAERAFIIDNPEYIKRVRLNKWIGGIPKKLKIFKAYPEHFDFGYGDMDILGRYLADLWPNFTRHFALNSNAVADWTGFLACPRDYQKKAIDTIMAWKYGILQAPCSSGKTYMGHCMAARTGKKTLWLTHKGDLLEQSYEEGLRLFNGNDSKLGKITNGKVEIGEVITYATVQTLEKYVDELADVWDCIIVDECHRAATHQMATRMAKCISTIKATYKYGLSATPETHDGYYRTIISCLGPIRYVIEKEQLENDNQIMPVTIIPVPTNWSYPDEAFMSDGTVDWQQAIHCMVEDEERNKQIADICASGGTVMVLAKQVEHLVQIANLIPSELHYRTCVITSKSKTLYDISSSIEWCSTIKARKAVLDKVKDGTYTIMLATYSLAQEGLNIPRLSKVIMAFPAIEENIITQVLGRVARVHNEKNEAICYDLVDRPKYFQRKFNERKRLYKKLNYKLMDY